MSLAKPHLGWENEHLAAYLLSRIAFIANPISVGDDIGADFVCTLFERRNKNAYEILVPKESFVIQIKSNSRVFQLTDTSLEYVRLLTMPYFLGVIDRDKLCMRIYSGEWLPIMFVHKGRPKDLRLNLDLTHSKIDESNYLAIEPKATWTIKLPFVTDLSVHDSTESLKNSAEKIRSLSSRISENLTSINAHEFILRTGPNSIRFFYGEHSAQYFLGNFMNRLTEVLINLVAMSKRESKHCCIDAIRIYDRLVKDLRSLYDMEGSEAKKPMIFSKELIFAYEHFQAHFRKELSE